MNLLMPQYTKKLIEIVSDRNLYMKPLGFTGKWPIWLIQNQSAIEKTSDNHVVIVAGFHGEEQAGPWAILKWLENCEEDCALSIIPVVNPTGFNIKKRYNTWNEKNNCGFCHETDSLSVEGKIIYETIDSLFPVNGFLSLHEDIECQNYYAYTFEKDKVPGKFTCGLLQELARHFKKPLNGVTVRTDSGPNNPYVVNGLVYKHCDGSLEDFMFHRGVPYVAVTETPGYRTRLQRRINACVAIIDRFIELVEK